MKRFWNILLLTSLLWLMAGSAEGAGITLSLIALVLAVVFFVVLVAAVGLGVIGVGYWQSMAD